MKESKSEEEINTQKELKKRITKNKRRKEKGITRGSKK